MTGLGKEEFIGRSVYDIKDELIKGEAVTLKVFEEKKPVTMNVEYKNGTYLTFAGKPIYDNKGEVRKVIATGRDMTELVNLEKKLRKTEEQREKYLSELKKLEGYTDTNDVIYSST